ncbi:hypothetical protein D3C71_2004980 [compost metagenome]
MVGITAIGDLAGLTILAVVSGRRTLSAQLFLMILTRRAVLAAIDQAADCDPVANFKAADGVANGGHMADDLVARYAWVNSVVPVVLHLVGV